MNALLSKYQEHLVIIAVPCNQFGLQEPGDNLEILAGLKYVRPGHGFVPASGIQFFDKSSVNGPQEMPLYTFLKDACPPSTLEIGDPARLYWSPIKVTDITWNFEKFLIDPSGRPRYRFHPASDPAQLETFISQLLDEVKFTGLAN